MAQVSVNERVLAQLRRQRGHAPAPVPGRRSHAPSGRRLGLLVGGLIFALLVSGLSIAILGWFSLAVVVVVALCALVVYDFRFGAVALMIAMPLSATKLSPSYSGINVQNILTVFTLLSYLLYRYGHKVRYRLLEPRLLVYLVVFCAAGLSGSRYAEQIAAAFHDLNAGFGTRPGFLVYYVAKPGLMIVMAWLIGAAVRKSRSPDGFVTAMGFGALVPAVFMAVYFVLTGISLDRLVNYRSFLSALGMHSNQLAVVLNVSIACLLFYALECRAGFRRLWTMGVVVYLSLMLLLTFSRGGYIGFVIILVAYFAQYRDGKRLLLGLIVVSAAAFFIPDAVYDRVTLGVTHGSQEDLSSGRVDNLWLPLLPRVLESPLWGHGLIFVAHSGLPHFAAQAHNAWLDLLLDAGILGLVVVLGFYFSMVRSFWRAIDDEPLPQMKGFFRGASVGLVALLVQAFFDDRLFPNTPQLMFWMAYGLYLGRTPKLLKDRKPDAEATTIMEGAPA
jgi:hypothetical protein